MRADDGLASPGAGTLVEHRQLLEELGGTYREVVGSDVATALVQAARSEGATQLVLGASHRSRWDELTRGSIIGGIIREAGRALDVHVISTSDDSATERTALPAMRTRLTPLPRRRQLAGVLVAIIGLPLLTLVLTPFRDTIGFTTAAFCYLMVVVAAATIGGRWPAALAAVAGFGFLNWFFAEPLHTFTIRNERDLAAVAAFLLVAGVVSTLVDHSARRTAEASRARSEAEALAGMAGSLLRKGDPIPELLANLVALFRLDQAVVVRTEPDLEVLAEAGTDPGRGRDDAHPPAHRGSRAPRHGRGPAGGRPRGARRLRVAARRGPRDPAPAGRSRRRGGPHAGQRAAHGPAGRRQP